MSNPNTPFGATSNTSSFGQAVDVGVSWRNIEYSVGDKQILRGLTGNALPRRTLAVMGSSGAGKTTFINALSDRLASDDKKVRLSGERFFNNIEYQRKYRTMVGYVTQDDILNPMSNPAESLSFSLRCRRGTSKEDTAAAVEHMLDELNLHDARDTIVGIPGIVQGLSGGERKRTNIGVELITNPKILYLDEPTSGLDSVTAAKICQLLKKLALRGRTVVFTIHQPTAECIEQFDDLMLMVKGKVIYHGACADAVDYFASIGFPCPETHTPTDFFMTLMQNEELQDALSDKWDEFLKNTDVDTYAYTAPPKADNESFTERYLQSYSAAASASYGIQFTELLQRAWKSVQRNKLLIIATFIQNIFFAIIAGLIFINLKDTVTGINDRIGLLFMIVTNLSFSAVMGTINNFPPQKAVFIRDQQSGAYSPFLYFVTLYMADLPLHIPATFIQSAIVYWVTGLIPEASNFFYFFAVCLATQQVGAGFGLAISTAIDNYVVASGVAPMIIIPFMLCAGLLASTDRLHPYWYWLEKPSFLRAAFLLLAHNEFEDLDSISCDAEKFGASFCARQPQNGKQVLAVYEFDGEQGEPWLQWVILAAIFVVTRLLCVFFLYKIAKTRN